MFRCLGRPPRGRGLLRELGNIGMNATQKQRRMIVGSLEETSSMARLLKGNNVRGVGFPLNRVRERANSRKKVVNRVDNLFRRTRLNKRDS
jgi:hypothetical protein